MIDYSFKCYVWDLNDHFVVADLQSCSFTSKIERLNLYVDKISRISTSSGDTLLMQPTTSPKSLQPVVVSRPIQRAKRKKN